MTTKYQSQGWSTPFVMIIVLIPILLFCQSFANSWQENNENKDLRYKIHDLESKLTRMKQENQELKNLLTR